MELHDTLYITCQRGTSMTAWVSGELQYALGKQGILNVNSSMVSTMEDPRDRRRDHETASDQFVMFLLTLEESISGQMDDFGVCCVLEATVFVLFFSFFLGEREREKDPGRLHLRRLSSKASHLLM